MTSRKPTWNQSNMQTCKHVLLKKHVSIHFLNLRLTYHCLWDIAVLLPGARNTFRGKLGRSRGEMSYLPVYPFLFHQTCCKLCCPFYSAAKAGNNPKTLDDAVTGGAQQCQLEAKYQAGARAVLSFTNQAESSCDEIGKMDRKHKLSGLVLVTITTTNQ